MPLLASATRVDITPQLWLPSTGFSLIGKDASWECWGRLFATILRVQDDNGAKALIVAVDLHAGTRLVLRSIVDALAKLPDPGLRFGEDAIFLCATHTHSAPGNFYGYSYFDMFAGRAQGRNVEWVAWLGARIADAVAKMPPLREAKVGYGKAADVGLAVNRALVSYRRNVGAAQGDALQVVDPNVHALWFQAVDGSPIGGLGVFGAHNTVTGPDHRAMSSDAFGMAARRAMDEMWMADKPRAPFAIVSGATGDTLVNHGGWEDYQGDERWDTCTAFAKRLGIVGWKAAQAAQSASAAGGAVRVRYREATMPGAAITEPGPHVSTAPRALAAKWAVGADVGKGGPFEPPWKGVPPGAGPDKGDPQWPKSKLAPDWLSNALVEPPSRVAVRVLRIGGVTLVGVPGEPTTKTCDRIRARVGGDVLVCGYTGGYVGYFPTPEEYEHQDYEGNSTLWGRWTGDWIVEQVGRCADGQTTTVGNPGFRDNWKAQVVTREMAASDPKEGISLSAKAVKAGWRLDGTWCPVDRALHALSGDSAGDRFEVVQLFSVVGSKWSALAYRGQAITDRTRSIRVSIDLNRGRYRFQYVLPAEVGKKGMQVGFKVMHPGLLPAGKGWPTVVLG
jgi:neutral ceramidase